MKRRVAQYMIGTLCPLCKGKRLRREALSVKFADLDIAEMARVQLKQLGKIFHPFATGSAPSLAKLEREHPEKAEVTRRILGRPCARAWRSCSTLASAT
jgi:excinuclease ABC subunit A